MVVDIAPQTELATYTGLYYFASTSAAVLGPFFAGLLIDALGNDGKRKRVASGVSEDKVGSLKS